MVSPLFTRQDLALSGICTLLSLFQDGIPVVAISQHFEVVVHFSKCSLQNGGSRQSIHQGLFFRIESLDNLLVVNVLVALKSSENKKIIIKEKCQSRLLMDR